MYVGVQIVDTLEPNQTVEYFSWGWGPGDDVVWMVVPTQAGAPGVEQIRWNVSVERAADSVTYYVTITNLTPSPVAIEGRYAVLNG
jgi:hypothetical protein